MAIPLWIPLALMAAGTGANYVGSKKADDARSKSYNKYLADLEEQTSKGKAAANATAQLYADQPEKQQAAGEELAGQIKGGQIYGADNDPNAGAGDTSGSDQGKAVIRDAGQKRRAESKRYSQNLADSLGDLRGFGEGFLDASLGARDNATDLRQIASNMRGGNNVLNARLSADNEKGKGWGTAGDILSLAAMVTAPAALTAAPAAAGPTAAQTGVSGGASMVANPLATGAAAGVAPQASLALTPAQQAFGMAGVSPTNPGWLEMLRRKMTNMGGPI